MRSLELNVSGPRTLLHCDVHIGNWYSVEESGMGLVDWQCMATGEWALDFVYILMSALTVEDRRGPGRRIFSRSISRRLLRPVVSHRRSRLLGCVVVMYAIKDLYSNKIVGYSIDSRRKASLAV